MLDLSPDKIMALAVVALVVLGPHRLPQAARTAGRVLGHLRAMTASVQDEMRDALKDPSEAFHAAAGEYRPGDIRRSVRQAVTGIVVPPAPATPSQPGTPEPARSAALGNPGSGRAHPDDPNLN